MRTLQHLLTIMCFLGESLVLGLVVGLLVLIANLAGKKSIAQSFDDALVGLGIFMIVGFWLMLFWGYCVLVGTLLLQNSETWYQMLVLILSGILLPLAALAIFDVHTKLIVSRLYTGTRPLRYYQIGRWNRSLDARA